MQFNSYGNRGKKGNGINLYPHDYMYAFINNLLTGETIQLSLSPDSVSESISANVNQEDIVARSAPIITYTSTGARQVTVSFAQTEDTLPDGFNTIDSYVSALKSFVYPGYSNGLVSSPSCQLVIGTSLNVIGICQNVNVSWKPPYRNNRIQIAQIDITVLETRSSCPRCYRN